MCQDHHHAQNLEIDQFYIKYIYIYKILSIRIVYEDLHKDKHFST